MAENKQGRQNKKASRHRGSMKIITVILLLVCGSMGIHTWKNNQKTEQYAQMEENLKQQIEEEAEKQKAIEEQAEYLKSDDYIEDLAREKLGLIYDNEIIFKKRGR